MENKHTWRAWTPVLVLVTALYALTFQACHSPGEPSYEELAEKENVALVEAIRSAVQSPERARRIESIFQTYMEQEADYFSFVIDLRAQVQELSADHTTPREVLVRRMNDLGLRRRETAAMAAESIGMMKGLLSREEWAEVWGAVREIDNEWESLRP